jgi:glucose-1-phosphate thymidylyltransferase
VKLVVLAAGYATRLYPLTRDRPKHLLEVGGRPILEHLIDRLAPIRELDGLVVVTNAKFADPFRSWASSYTPPHAGLAPTVVDDGTSEDADRLGAIGDLQLVLARERIDDDVIVAAGDSVFTDDLGGFGAFGRAKGASAIAVIDLGDPEPIKRYSAIEVDADDRVTSLEEKPEHPRSTLAGIALYYYPRSVLPLVRRYLDEGNNPDQPGRLAQWLHTRVPVYAWRIPGRWYDIGSHETLRAADEEFTKTPRS